MLLGLAEKILNMALVLPARRLPALQKIVRYVATTIPISPGTRYLAQAKYAEMRSIFIGNGAASTYDQATRSRIVGAFERIHAEVEAAHPPTDALFIAETLLALECPGVIVECGCYRGASAAKLSILARETGRRLLVFDSFEGLPEVDADLGPDFYVRDGSHPRWARGRYDGGLDLVKANIERLGDLTVTSFYKGWFKDTLTATNITEPIALAFTDVDLASSARDCLVGLWPRLSDGGVLFSHDVAFLHALQAMTDENLWRDVLGEQVPILFGAGYGMCDASPHLGFMVKGRNLSPAYLQKLAFHRARAARS